MEHRSSPSSILLWDEENEWYVTFTMGQGGTARCAIVHTECDAGLTVITFDSDNDRLDETLLSQLSGLLEQLGWTTTEMIDEVMEAATTALVEIDEFLGWGEAWTIRDGLCSRWCRQSTLTAHHWRSQP